MFDGSRNVLIHQIPFHVYFFYSSKLRHRKSTSTIILNHSEYPDQRIPMVVSNDCVRSCRKIG